jgi:hypothetical protein
MSDLFTIVLAMVGWLCGAAIGYTIGKARGSADAEEAYWDDLRELDEYRKKWGTR